MALSFGRPGSVPGGERVTVFIKTFVPKRIRSRVYVSADDLAAEARGLEAETALLVSEIVSFVAEACSWLVGDEVLSIACYEGEADLTKARELAVECIWRREPDRCGLQR